MATDLINLDAAGKQLAELTSQIDAASTIPELVTVEKKIAAFGDLLRRAKFALVWQNNFFKIRVRARIELGKFLMAMEKNKGGRPSEKTPSDAEGVSQDAPPTLDDLGIGHTFSHECQTLARAPAEDIEAYFAENLAPNVVVDADNPPELTMSGLFEHLRSNEWRRQKAAQQEEERARRIKEAEQAHRSSAGSQTVSGPKLDEDAVEIDPETMREPPPPEQPKQSPRQASAATVISVTRMAFGNNPNPHERENARRALEKIGQNDPNFSMLEKSAADAYVVNKYLADQSNNYYKSIQQLQEKVRELEAANHKLRRMRDQHRKIIRDLKPPMNDDDMEAFVAKYMKILRDDIGDNTTALFIITATLYGVDHLDLKLSDFFGDEEPATASTADEITD
jgi:hypothetical protein